MNAMSDTTPNKSADTKGPKAASPPPSEAKISKNPTPETKTSKNSSTETSGPGNSGVASEKSSRESIGGPSAVHYGYFSNIKSPEYRSGWDDIWSKKKSKPRTKKPVCVNFSFQSLPNDVQSALVAAARKELKKARVNFDNREKMGEVIWHLKCEVKS
mgnify:CR=1 FL=1